MNGGSRVRLGARLRGKATGEPDTFRIRIWWDDSGTETVLIDSETSVLGKGSIVIH